MSSPPRVPESTCGSALIASRMLEQSQDPVQGFPRSTMTLDEFKKAVRGRKLFVWVQWNDNDGDYFPVSVAAFLRSIGADVPYSRDGLHPSTVIRARFGQEDNQNVYVN